MWGLAMYLFECPLKLRFFLFFDQGPYEVRGKKKTAGPEGTQIKCSLRVQGGRINLDLSASARSVKSLRRPPARRTGKIDSGPSTLLIMLTSLKRHNLAQ